MSESAGGVVLQEQKPSEQKPGRSLLGGRPPLPTGEIRCPFFGSRAVRIGLLTRGFASPPRDGFALIGKGSLRELCRNSLTQVRQIPTDSYGVHLHWTMRNPRLSRKRLFAI